MASTPLVIHTFFYAHISLWYNGVHSPERFRHFYANRGNSNGSAHLFSVVCDRRYLDLHGLLFYTIWEEVGRALIGTDLVLVYFVLALDCDGARVKHSENE